MIEFIHKAYFKKMSNRVYDKVSIYDKVPIHTIAVRNDGMILASQDDDGSLAWFSINDIFIID